MADDDLPVFSVWSQKFFGSSRVSACHGFAQGVYLVLLAREHGFRGRGLPSDDAALARLAGLDGPSWSQVKEEVLQFFELREGRLYNSTCEESIRLAMENKRQASEHGRAAARARWAGEPGPGAPPHGPDARAMPGQCPSNARASPRAMPEQCPPSPSPSDDGKPPPTPSASSPDGDRREEERPSACGEVFFALTETNGKGPLRRWRRREAHRLLEKFPELTRANLAAWEALSRRRPDVFAKALNPDGYLISLVWKYGTVESAGYAGPPPQSADERREAALSRRAAEVLAEIQSRGPGVSAVDALGEAPLEALRRRRGAEVPHG